MASHSNNSNGISPRLKMKLTPKEEQTQQREIIAHVLHLAMIPLQWLRDPKFRSTLKNFTIKVFEGTDPSHEGGESTAPRIFAIHPDDHRFLAERGLLPESHGPKHKVKPIMLHIRTYSEEPPELDQLTA